MIKPSIILVLIRETPSQFLFIVQHSTRTYLTHRHHHHRYSMLSSLEWFCDNMMKNISVLTMIF